MLKYLNRTDLLLRQIFNILKFYISIISIMLLFRLVFLAYFVDPAYFNNYLNDFFLAFFIGWKYDSIVASYLILPFVIVSPIIAVLKSRGLYNFIIFIKKISFVLFMSIICFILICDLGFYSFFQDHINILFFGLVEDDTKALMESIQKNYPLELAIGIYLGFIGCLIFLGQKFFKSIQKKSLPIIKGGFFKFVGMYTFILIILAGGLRGGYGELVISPKYTDFSENEFVNQLSYNGVIALEDAIKIRQSSNDKNFDMTKAMKYGDNIHQAFADYLGIDVGPTPKGQLLSLIKRRTPVNNNLKNPNVIVILMESFGAHWLNYHSEKFNLLGDLEEHFKEDFLFENFISSGNGTIGSLMALVSNIPPRPGKRFLSESKYMRLPLSSGAHIPYKNSNYETSFIYGGKLAWRNIGKYLKIQKYDHIIGENKIRTELSLKGKQGTEWGLYDEHFFNYIVKKVESSKKPQFFLGLSTSNHPPFEVPSSYVSKSLKIPESLDEKILREKDLFLQRFLAFQYANQALANFIYKIKNSALKENTIIAITGDHNFWGFMNYNMNESFSKYRVPFYLYIPEQMKVENYDLSKLGSHEDIMPTLYNLSLSDTEYLSFGEDLFSDGPTFAINNSAYASNDGVVYKNNFYSWDKKPLIQPKKSSEINDSLDRRYRSTMTISDFYLEEELKSVSDN